MQLIILLDNKLWINVELLRLTCWTANAGLQTDFYLQELVIATSGESHRCTAGRWASRRSPCFEVSGSSGPILRRHETASASHVRLTITYHTFRINITLFRKLCDLLYDEFNSTYVNPLSFLLQSLMYRTCTWKCKVVLCALSVTTSITNCLHSVRGTSWITEFKIHRLF